MMACSLARRGPLTRSGLVIKPTRDVTNGLTKCILPLFGFSGKWTDRYGKHPCTWSQRPPIPLRRMWPDVCGNQRHLLVRAASARGSHDAVPLWEPSNGYSASRPPRTRGAERPPSPPVCRRTTCISGGSVSSGTSQAAGTPLECDQSACRRVVHLTTFKCGATQFSKYRNGCNFLSQS